MYYEHMVAALNGKEPIYEDEEPAPLTLPGTRKVNGARIYSK